MFNEKWNDPNYCGYCKCEPCQCDGHGNFGGEQDGLDLIETEEETVVDDEEIEEGELTYEDGTPYDPDANKRTRVKRTDLRPSYRPQRPPR
jgi:hypothetical protein